MLRIAAVYNIPFSLFNNLLCTTIWYYMVDSYSAVYNIPFYFPFPFFKKPRLPSFFLDFFFYFVLGAAQREFTPRSTGARPGDVAARPHHYASAGGFEWPGAPQRFDDLCTGQRQAWLCRSCGETFDTEEILRLYVLKPHAVSYVLVYFSFLLLSVIAPFKSKEGLS